MVCASIPVKDRFYTILVLVLWISSDRDHQRLFGVLKFSIPGFWGVGKFGKSFLGGLIHVLGNFLAIWNNLKICDGACVSQPGCSAIKVQPN